MFYKINYVDCILWINLDSANERKTLTEFNLNNIKINNLRIVAIDAKKKNITPEYACILSHIKAINKAKELRTKYCLIIEDDVDFSNLNIFPWMIEDVIKNAPEFDILIISKTFNYELDKLYTSWNEMKNNGKFIKGAVAYIVSENFVNYFVSKCAYFVHDEFTIYNSHNMDYSENYLYTNVNSLVYKYNVVYQTSNDSTIQNKMLNQYKINNEFQKNIIRIDFPDI
jgi:GR25 family glycosyltransferase involved in LPS biosynthesis